MSTSKPLAGKKILFFAPKFFGYDLAIAQKMVELGADVRQFDERPKNNFLTKALIRIDRNIIKQTIIKYYKEILNSTQNEKFDFVFVVNLEAMTPEIVELLRKQQPQAKFILYMWDSIKNKKSAQLAFKLFDWCYSFDKNDSKTLPNVGFRPLFFIDEFDSRKWGQSISNTYDLCFIGTVHSDRYNLVNSIKKQAENLGLKTYFYLYFHNKILFFYKKIRDIKFYNARFREFQFKPILARDLAQKIKESGAVLDIQHPNQTGLTMRTLEMLGSSKKIVTTNKHIVEYDFFNLHNVAVIDRENPIINVSFFKTDFVEVDDLIRDKYALRGWILEIFKVNQP
jgi:hypothetical protein